MLRFGRLGRFSNRLASFDADLTVVGAGPGGYVAAIKDCLFIFLFVNNVRGSLNHDIFSATHTLSLSNLILKSQCVGGAKDVIV